MKHFGHRSFSLSLQKPAQDGTCPGGIRSADQMSIQSVYFSSQLKILRKFRFRRAKLIALSALFLLGLFAQHNVRSSNVGRHRRLSGRHPDQFVAFQWQRIFPGFYIYSVRYAAKENNTAELHAVAIGNALDELFWRNTSCACVYQEDQEPGPRRSLRVAGKLERLPESHRFEGRIWTAARLTCPFPEDAQTSFNFVSLQCRFERLLGYFLSGSVTLPCPQVPRRPPAQLTFAHCGSPIHTRFDRPALIVEYVEYYRLMGVTRFYEYAVDVSNRTRAVFDYYVGKGIMDVTDWALPEPTRKGIHYFGQLAALYDCLLKSSLTHDYTVYSDLDEQFVTAQSPAVFSSIVDNGRVDCSYVRSALVYPKARMTDRFTDRGQPIPRTASKSDFNASPMMIRKLSRLQFLLLLPTLGLVMIVQQSHRSIAPFLVDVHVSQSAETHVNPLRSSIAEPNTRLDRPVTVVTAYYNIPAKRSNITYERWMRIFLPKIPCHLYIYTESQYESYFLSLRKDHLDRTKIVIKPFTALKMYQKMDLWIEQKKMDHERLHTPELYVLWNEKLSFLAETIKDNTFDSDYFLWTDIGSFRDPRRAAALTTYPDTEITRRTLGSNKVFFLQMYDFTAEEKELNPVNGLPKHDFRYDVRLGGAVLGGHRNAVLHYQQIYHEIMDKMINAGRFVGKDQNIMSSVAILHPELVRLVPRAPYLNGGLDWFYSLYYFSRKGP
ncbi:hypothetical protein BV898_13033 [Hypsibius exemplaris]|uniref:Glycosyltransferase family 92 protein n=1 Tax=Hypsibius exemplaris TaxID=2072580 RepID=A0A1W0WC23_HYPEX|nr:hypothetical protein BV898_13033 [Hypsibius exemplaris]